MRETAGKRPAKLTAVRAPGKVVVSGAYSVLEGAPALVTAIDRYVVADAAEAADFVTPEVRCALGEHPPPWFDGSALRHEGRKLGLGSSAAILVASLGAKELQSNSALTDAELRQRVFARAWSAHAQAQGGGSGIDVAASTWGGTLVATRGPKGPVTSPVDLPRRVHFQVLACPESASTANLLLAVSALRARRPDTYRALMDAQARAAEDAALAAARNAADAFLAALRAQCSTLAALGFAADVRIVTPGVAALNAMADREGGVCMPAGAGGGDIALFVGTSQPSSLFLLEAQDQGFFPLALRFSAGGLQRLGVPTVST